MTAMLHNDLPTALREGTEFILNGRSGRIAHNQIENCLVIWDEYTDSETGEVHAPISDILSFFDLGRALQDGYLRITAHPGQRPDGRQAVKEVCQRIRSKAEHRRALGRLCYIDAASELIKEGKLGETRLEFEEANQRRPAGGHQ